MRGFWGLSNNRQSPTYSLYLKGVPYLLSLKETGFGGAEKSENGKKVVKNRP